MKNLLVLFKNGKALLGFWAAMFSLVAKRPIFIKPLDCTWLQKESQWTFKKLSGKHWYLLARKDPFDV